MRLQYRPNPIYPTISLKGRYLQFTLQYLLNGDIVRFRLLFDYVFKWLAAWRILHG